MAHIEISNLTSAGSDLFVGADSFLTELQTTETTQIFGGYRQRCGRKFKNTSIKIRKPKTSIKLVVKSKPAPCFVPAKKRC
jgi:hypothetical protein